MDSGLLEDLHILKGDDLLGGGLEMDFLPFGVVREILAVHLQKFSNLIIMSPIIQVRNDGRKNSAISTSHSWHHSLMPAARLPFGRQSLKKLASLCA